ncbi:hypothetical protein NPIL_56481 [Nephila pilipes]|uniref:Uncharacterized protein n=1 Tax=Nephila pilipes TaxID=299642 RepID=A0A8X6NZS6_NEPPI|nr:hypothetical protein NPIL_56481 [Nephila pilipes]
MTFNVCLVWGGGKRRQPQSFVFHCSIQTDTRTDDSASIQFRMFAVGGSKPPYLACDIPKTINPGLRGDRRLAPVLRGACIKVPRYYRGFKGRNGPVGTGAP